MGILSDIDELKRAWTDLPLSLKLFFSTTTLITVLSIGSISKDIIEFRGFLRDGIDLYQAVIDPIRNWINSLFNISYTSYQVDVIILFNIIMIAFYRSTRISKNHAQIETSKNADQKGEKYQLMMMLIAMPITFASPTTDFKAGILLLLAYLIALVITLVVGWVEGTIRKDLLILHLNIATPFLLLSLAAALSYGVSAPLPNHG